MRRFITAVVAAALLALGGAALAPAEAASSPIKLVRLSQDAYTYTDSNGVVWEVIDTHSLDANPWIVRTQAKGTVFAGPTRASCVDYLETHADRPVTPTL